MFSSRLKEIRKSLIKNEAVDVNNDRQIPGNDRQNRDVRHQASNNIEGIRDQFLNRTLTAEKVIENLSGRDTHNMKHESQQIEGIFNRAQDINARLSGTPDESTFYARIPQTIRESNASTRHESPLVQNYGNSMFNFQTTSDKVKEVMIDSNPHRDIPYKVQSLGKGIGADLELIRKSFAQKGEAKKRKIPAPPSFSESSKAHKIDEQATSSKADYRTVELCNKSTETTRNTGDLQFEITSNDLENLSEEKKVILLEFMKAFNIRDNRVVKSIRERLKHKLANQNLKRQQQKSMNASYPPTFGPPI